MPNIGSTGLYVDSEGNEYAATVIGRSFKVDSNGKKVESGKFQVLGTFRDGQTRVFSNVDAGELSEPQETAPPTETTPVEQPETDPPAA